MREPRYLLFCLLSLVVGCPVGAVWFELALAAKDREYSPFALLPLSIFDSFLVGWFPALLFGALLHYLMQQLQWRKLWQWTIGGGFLAWGLFLAGAQAAKPDVGLLRLFFMGITLLKNISGHTWPAAICGAVVSAALYFVAAKFAPVATPVASS
jgi:hypothetical protein